MFSSAAQPKKALSPMASSVLGSATVCRFVLPLNAYAGIAVTPSGTVMLVSFAQP